MSTPFEKSTPACTFPASTIPARTRMRARESCAAAISCAMAVTTLGLAALLAHPASARAAGRSDEALPVVAVAAQSSGQGGASLEAAASKAGSVGRKVAMSLIGLGFAIAAIVLVFRRDFKEAAGVFAVGLLAILLATPSGVNVLHDTVSTLFGSQ